MKLNRYSHMDIKNIVNQVKNEGIYKFEKLLDDQDLDNITNILNKNESLKGETNSLYYRSKKNYKLFQLLKFKFRNLFIYSKLLHLSKKLKFKELATEILGRETKLLFIDSYFSKISNDKVLDWHVDQAYSGKLDVKKFVDPNHAAIKFFIYLTDVSKQNGCLGYIPGSHKILYFLKHGILNHNIKYKPYWKLKDLRDILKNDNYRNYLETKIEKKLIDDFMNKTQFINSDLEDIYNYDFYSKKGDALIFDESGVHRGAELLKTNRLVLRFAYKDINAPD